MITNIHRDRNGYLSELFQSVDSDLTVSSPYISDVGAEFLSNNVSSKFKEEGILRFLTDLSPRNIYQGSTNPNSFRILFNSINTIQLFHLPRLHAKVYISDEKSAVITSGNLTAGGIFRNFEYGVRINETEFVSSIKSDLLGFADLGAKVGLAEINHYCDISDEVSKLYRAKEKSVKSEVEQRFREAITEANDQLISASLSGGALHTVFERTIKYLLNKNGPMATTDIHLLIEDIHPDLCDNSVDRVIDGVRFGKKWKHAVRTAQQQLKKKGTIDLVNGLWTLIK